MESSCCFFSGKVISTIKGHLELKICYLPQNYHSRRNTLCTIPTYMPLSLQFLYPKHMRVLKTLISLTFHWPYTTTTASTIYLHHHHHHHPQHTTLSPVYHHHHHHPIISPTLTSHYLSFLLRLIDTFCIGIKLNFIMSHYNMQLDR